MIADLSKTTITIPIFYDTNDRRENLVNCLTWLANNLKTTVIIGEISNGKETSKLVEKVNTKDLTIEIVNMADTCLVAGAYMHRTKALNMMASMCNTQYIVNYDADVILPQASYVAAQRAFETTKKLGAIYPYDGTYIDIPRRNHKHLIDSNSLQEGRRVGSVKSFLSVGGAIFWRKSTYWEAGGENENFITYGAEDIERVKRMEILGVTYARVKDSLFHLEHARTPNSTNKHPYWQTNEREYARIANMDKKTLQSEISTWKPKRKHK